MTSEAQERLRTEGLLNTSRLGCALEHLNDMSCSRDARHFPEHHVQTALRLAFYCLIHNGQVMNTVSK